MERAAAAAAEEERLRYLEFVQQAAAQALVLAAAAYAYAKQGAGPLRPGVDHVEGTVKAVVGPVYDRFHAVPLDLLKFIDRKVKRRVSSLIWFSSSYVEIVLQIRLEFDEMKFAGLGFQDGICQFSRVEIMSI